VVGLGRYGGYRCSREALLLEGVERRCLLIVAGCLMN
jgi:hypothetical protein